MAVFPHPDRFATRHLGPREGDLAGMLEVVGATSLDALIDEVVPRAIRTERPLDLPAALTEAGAIAALAERAGENELFKSLLGMGYHDTHTPPVILRNILENPGWYTAYTPYQAEIAQGRLEALLVFQTVVEDLTGMEISNASLLDEATGAAEAMTMAHRLSKKKVKGPDGKKRSADAFLVASDCHPQTLALIETRAEPLGIEVRVADPEDFVFDEHVFGCIVQYPATDGRVRDLGALVEGAHDADALVVFAVDLLSLTLLRPPGELGADIVVGNSQRFGVPLGYGGPHAAFLATKEAFKRQVPGRIIGVSKDAAGNPALRMALQTREQHIRRQKATSNICTAQVLLAVCAGMYAVWHGPEGLAAIARRARAQAATLAEAARRGGHAVRHEVFFDTLAVEAGSTEAADGLVEAAAARRINLRRLDETGVGIALDETVGDAELEALLQVLGCKDSLADVAAAAADGTGLGAHARTSPYLQDPRFHLYRSETEMLRYLHRLEARDLALNVSMIPLGSCTMKLNAAAEMIPVTFPGFGKVHPFAPVEQARGYARLFEELEAWLAEITGFAAVSLQPNAGSQGEYAGLLAIAAYHEARGEGHRHICLIPQSAHGTNPASAVMAGMDVVVVQTDDSGNIDVDDLRARAEEHSDRLAALMVTYPSTHGVFEPGIREICAVIHEHGGQVYMDGANMNAMVGLCRPGEFGADVCHLNLHKTFCIPHGGGGPGMGPIGVAAHLAPFLPGHPLVETGGETPLGTISAAPWGSPSILPISWAYIAMMGPEGLTQASKVAILSANYIAKRLEGAYDVLYTGASGRVAHECILDTRPFKASGVEVDDLAKRLMDFGFHAPTMSFPVAGTLMVEPTESESREELDRFCEAMLAIRGEIRDVEEGRVVAAEGPLANAPHTLAAITAEAWDRPYSRQQAAWPARWLAAHKYWPAVARIDNAYGDRHLVCSCDAWPVPELADAAK